MGLVWFGLVFPPLCSLTVRFFCFLWWWFVVTCVTGDAIELIRELLKKKQDEMPSVRIGVRNAWTYLEHGLSITFTEFVQFLPYFDTYFKHQMVEKLKVDGKKDKLGFDPAIFI